MSEPTDDLAEADERPWEEPGSCRMDCAPHRGPLLDFLAGVSGLCGLLALCFCLPGVVGLPLGFAVWLTACQDLKKMEAGQMDPSGRSKTNRARKWAIAGMVLSAVCGVPSGLFYGCNFFYFPFRA